MNPRSGKLLTVRFDAPERFRPGQQATCIATQWVSHNSDRTPDGVQVGKKAIIGQFSDGTQIEMAAKWIMGQNDWKLPEQISLLSTLILIVTAFGLFLSPWNGIVSILPVILIPISSLLINALGDKILESKFLGGLF